MHVTPAAFTGFILLKLASITVAMQIAFDPFSTASNIFLLASIYAWAGLILSHGIGFVRHLTKTSQSVLLIGASQVCGVLSCICVLWLDTRSKGFNDIASELFWLKSGLFLAVLGYSLGETGLNKMFESIVSRK